MLGALWFTLLFKKQYLISLEKENEPEQKPASIFIIGQAVCTLAITMTILMNTLKTDSYQSTIELALIIGIGYMVANTVNIAINPNISRPILYGVISGSYHLIGILIVCIVLYDMNK